MYGFPLLSIPYRIHAVRFIKHLSACFFVFPSATFFSKYRFASSLQRNWIMAARYNTLLSLLFPTALLVCLFVLPELFSLGAIPAYLTNLSMVANRPIPPLWATTFAATIVPTPFIVVRFFP